MYHRIACLVVVLYCMVLTRAARPQTNAVASFHFDENFSEYRDGSSGEPNWEATGLGFEVQPGPAGKVLQATVPDARGFLILRKAPLAHEVTMEATITPQQSFSTEWKTAGIGVYLNGNNYWHLALVEATGALNDRHSVELSEMLDGVWTAQGEAATRLTVAEETPNFEWRYGQPYKFRIVLARDRISGEILEGDTLRYRCVRLFDKPAVTLGRPMLAASHLAVSFTDVCVEAGAPANAAETAAAEPATTFPRYVARGAGKTRRSQPAFFRTALRNNVWWLLDPNGRPMLSIGTDHVNYNAHNCEKLGYAPYHRNVERKYGSEEAWAKIEIARLLSWNFNVLGTGNSPATRHKGMAHSDFLSFATDFSNIAAIVPKTTWTGWPDVFDPRFARFCDLRARERCAPNRNDEWLLGYYLDNELEWWGKHGAKWGIAEEAWKLPAERAGKRAFIAALRRFYGDRAQDFNTDFGTRIAGFDELLAVSEPKQPVTDRGPGTAPAPALCVLPQADYPDRMELPCPRRP